MINQHVPFKHSIFRFQFVFFFSEMRVCLPILPKTCSCALFHVTNPKKTWLKIQLVDIGLCQAACSSTCFFRSNTWRTKYGSLRSGTFLKSMEEDAMEMTYPRYVIVRGSGGNWIIKKLGSLKYLEIPGDTWTWQLSCFINLSSSLSSSQDFAGISSPYHCDSWKRIPNTLLDSEYYLGPYDRYKWSYDPYK